ncbi:MAG: ABC transporter ATP-binding protein [Rhizobiaceae bacterium]
MADHGAQLSLKGVEKRYGHVAALHPTDLEIEPGEFFSLIGPSGSGKTTLLGTVAGFVLPTSGVIAMDGTNIASLPPYRRNIGMVFQNYALFPHMNVFDNVAFPLKLRGMAKAEISGRVQRMLETVRLPGVGDRLPSQLSGGQQQRVALARAAVYDPRMLLMDEPLGALDKNLREEMQSEIKAFHRQIAATILYVTHDQDEATTMSDRLAIMNDGHIVQHGTPRDLYEHPANAFVARFLGNANLFAFTEPVCAGGQEVVVRSTGGRSLRAVAPCGARPAAESWLACVRPETVRIEPAGKPCGSEDLNAAEGEVLDAVYTAGTFRYQVRLDDGSRFAVTLPSVRQGAMFKPGERVALAWPANATLLIPKE